MSLRMECLPKPQERADLGFRRVASGVVREAGTAIEATKRSEASEGRLELFAAPVAPPGVAPGVGFLPLSCKAHEQPSCTDSLDCAWAALKKRGEVLRERGVC